LPLLRPCRCGRFRVRPRRGPFRPWRRLASDRSITALLRDLRRRGFAEDTLIVWTTEVGRTPFSQGSLGRDHHCGSFVNWLWGAGIKGGINHGVSEQSPITFAGQHAAQVGERRTFGLFPAGGPP
jgi:uncharacterized protein (DUF1501 family)